MTKKVLSIIVVLTMIVSTMCGLTLVNAAVDTNFPTVTVGSATIANTTVITNADVPIALSAMPALTAQEITDSSYWSTVLIKFAVPTGYTDIDSVTLTGSAKRYDFDGYVDANDDTQPPSLVSTLSSAWTNSSGTFSTTGMFELSIADATAAKLGFTDAGLVDNLGNLLKARLKVKAIISDKTIPLTITEFTLVNTKSREVKIPVSNITNGKVTIGNGGAPTTYDVTVTNGTVDLTPVASGATVTITADTAPTGQQFKNWTSSDVTFADSTSATTTFTMPAKAVAVTANYEDIPATTYDVTVTNGTVDLTPVVSGATVTITADTAPTGQRFKNWTSTDVTFADSTSAITTFTMPANAVAVTANYEDIPAITGTSAQLPTLTDKAPGTDVSVTVTFKELPAGTKSFDFGLTYDSDLLSYKSFVKGTDYSTDPDTDYSTDPEVNFATAGALGVAGITTNTGVEGEQVVVTLVFTVIAGSPDGTTDLTLSGVKYGDVNSNNVVIPSDKIVNGSIGIKTPVVPVESAKVQAKLDLATALATYISTDYSEVNWTALNTAKTDGDSAIDAATTTAGVALAKQAALDDMADVKTLAEELADAKTDAKADLATALATYISTDYSEANWTALNTAKTDGDAAIDAATTTDGVALAKQAALDDMADVKTLAEEAAIALSDAKTDAKADLATALATYISTDYSEANWTALNTAKTDGDSAIDAATTTDGVALAKQAALDDMADVKTKAEQAAEARAAAMSKVNSGAFTLAELKATDATGIVDDNFNSYKFAMAVQKELKEADLVIADINSAIVAANGITTEMRGDVITGGDEDGMSANDASAVKQFIIRVGKTTLTLEQALKTDFNNDGIVNVTDVTNILIQAATNNVPQA